MWIRDTTRRLLRGKIDVKHRGFAAIRVASQMEKRRYLTSVYFISLSHDSTNKVTISFFFVKCLSLCR